MPRIGDLQPAPQDTESRERAASLVLLSEDQLQDDLIEEALRSASEALEAYTAMQNNAGRADALRALIAVKFRMANGQRPTEALELADTERANFKEVGNIRGEASMMLAKATINADKRGTKNREAALMLAQEARAMLAELEDEQLEAEAMHLIVAIMIKKCDRMAGPVLAKQAVKLAKQCVEVFRALEDKRGEGNALHHLAIAKWYTDGPFRDGLKDGQQALEAYRSKGKKWNRLVGFQLHSLAEWAVRKEQDKEAVQYSKQAFEHFQEMALEAEASGATAKRVKGLRSWELACLQFLVEAYVLSGDKEAAMQAAREGVERLKECGDKDIEAHVMSVLSAAHLLVGDSDEALTTMQGSLALYRDVGDKRAEGYVLEAMVEVHKQAKEPDEELANFQEALTLAEELKDVRTKARVLSGMVDALMQKQDWPGALEKADAALEVVKACKDPDGEAVILLNTAGIYSFKQDFEMAVEKAQEALAIFQGLENQVRMAECLYFLHEINTQAEDHQEALDKGEEARKIYKKLGQKGEEAAMLTRISQSNVNLAVKADKEPEPQGQGAKAKKEAADLRKKSKKLWSAALKNAKEAFAIAKKLGRKDPRKDLFVDAATAVAQVLGMTGKYKEAKELAEEGMEAAKSREQQCGTTLLLGQIHRWNGKVEEAKRELEKAHLQAQKIRDEYLEQLASYLLQQLDPNAFAGQGQAYDGGGPTQGGPIVPAAADSGVTALGPYAGPTKEQLAAKITDLAQTLVNVEELPADVPLMDAGLDSLSMVQFRNSLQQQFPGIPMPASLIFDYPSVRAVSGNIAEELQEAWANGKQIQVHG